MKKLILPATTGFILFGLVLYISANSISTILEPLRENAPDIIGVSVSAGEAATTNKSEEETLQPTVIDEVDPSVFSVINLRFIGETYIISGSDIENLIGNKTKLSEAKSYWSEFGKNKTEQLLLEVLKAEEFDLKNFQINKNGINPREISGFDYYDQESSPNVSVANAVIHELIEARLKTNIGYQAYIKVPELKHLGTNGEYTDGKYIELDHSAQVIYAWEHGNLYKSWDSSGFFDEYAVFGVFEVINKSRDAWSPIAEKWMPYWMAFYWDKKQQAWFGIHELVYWYDAQGNRHEESSDSIGFKKSGGCVRLDRGEMKELYQWAEVGMPFLIYE